jgi:threonine/homoserine/homoserine lactone efflux protein
LLQSALAFNIIKYLGAAYLIYLGLRKLLIREEVETKIVLEQQSLRRIFFQGMVVNLLNPKTALFFFAFLPQFVNPTLGSVATQIFFLGIIFILMALVSDGMYAILAGTAGNWLRGNLQFLKAQRYVAGTIYIALGLTAAFTGHKNS